MKKMFAGLLLSLTTITSFAEEFIYSGTHYEDMDAYAMQVLHTSHVVVAKAGFGDRAGTVANAYIFYDAKTKQCVTFFHSILAIDTMEGSGDLTVFLDSSSFSNFEYGENKSKDGCAAQFKKTVDTNFRGFSQMIAEKVTKNL